MVYTEEIRDLFSMPEDYYLAQCISADFGMGRGIAVEFNKRFNTKNNLMIKYPDYLSNHNDYDKILYGDCLLDGRVLNLVTKIHYWDKPTIYSLIGALSHMRQTCLLNNITKVAMPAIGCGLDRLRWDDVYQAIHSVFNDMDIEIVVCKLN
jgi:hypothetical protein